MRGEAYTDTQNESGPQRKFTMKRYVLIREGKQCFPCGGGFSVRARVP